MDTSHLRPFRNTKCVWRMPSSEVTKASLPAAVCFALANGCWEVAGAVDMWLHAVQMMSDVDMSLWNFKCQDSKQALFKMIAKRRKKNKQEEKWKRKELSEWKTNLKMKNRFSIDQKQAGWGTCKSVPFVLSILSILSALSILSIQSLPPIPSILSFQPILSTLSYPI